MPEKSVIAQNIERLMVERGFNESSLSAAVGAGATLVRDILSGKSQSPRHVSIERIARVLGVPPYALTQNPEQLSALIALGEVTEDFTPDEIGELKAIALALKTQRLARN